MAGVERSGGDKMETTVLEQQLKKAVKKKVKSKRIRVSQENSNQKRSAVAILYQTRQILSQKLLQEIKNIIC